MSCIFKMNKKQILLTVCVYNFTGSINSKKQHTETNDEAYVNYSLHPIFKSCISVSSNFQNTVIDVNLIHT